MITRLLPAIVFLLVTPLDRLNAGRRADEPMPRYDNCVIATVKDVPEGKFNRGDSPAIKIEITQTIMGKLNGEQTVYWVGPNIASEGDPRPRNGPLKLPKVGDKLILFINYDMRDKLASGPNPNKDRMIIWEEQQHPLNDRSLRLVRDIYKPLKNSKSASPDQLAAIEKLDAQAAKEVAAWQERNSPEVVAATIKSADAVFVAKYKGPANSLSPNMGGGVQLSSSAAIFEVSDTFKGSPRCVPPKTPQKVTVDLSDKIMALLEGDAPYLLFLSEKKFMLGFNPTRGDYYTAIGEGVLPAPEATLKAARKATEGLAGQGRPGVIVLSDAGGFADVLEAASADRMTVIRVNGSAAADIFTRHPETYPNTHFLLSVEYISVKKAYYLNLFSISDGKTPISTAKLAAPDKDALAKAAGELIDTALKKLPESK